MITFSIIIPVHNVELYLEEAVASVLAQTYRNFELILVDDGSTDNSNIIAEKFAAGDNRICIVTKNAGGAGSARNAGLL
ncbi:MAG: glycosyltransferase, partial [Pedobacter sp.]